jgi:hypothetical protein
LPITPFAGILLSQLAAKILLVRSADCVGRIKCFMNSKVAHEGSRIEKRISQFILFLKYLWLFILIRLIVVPRLFVTGCRDDMFYMSGCKLNNFDASAYVNLSIWAVILGFVVVWPIMSIVVHFIGCAIHHTKQNT